MLQYKLQRGAGSKIRAAMFGEKDERALFTAVYIVCMQDSS